MRYHVFIEGPRDATASGIELLASALARHYGASPAEVRERLKAGRFCARSALDLTPAQHLAKELEALGASTSVVPDLERGAPRYESGLAAAFAGSALRENVGLDLGVLGDPEVAELTDAGWTLANVDGSTDPSGTIPPIDAGTRRAARADGTAPIDPPPRPAPTRLGSAGPPPIPRSPGNAAAPPAARGDGASAALPRAHVVTRGGPPSTEPPIGVAADDESTRVDPVQAAAPARPRFEGAKPDQPAPDPFRPPDLDRPLPRLATLPIRLFTSDGPAAATGTAAAAANGSSLLRPTLGARTRDALGDSSRGRLVAGLLLAFVVGFVPAQLYASSRAGAAHDDASAALVAEYSAADTPERWRALASTREEAAALLDARRDRVVVSACLLWAVVAGAVGFAWFRVTREPGPPRPA